MSLGEYIKAHSDSLASSLTAFVGSTIFFHKNFDMTDWFIHSSYMLASTFVIAVISGIGGWIGKKIIEWVWFNLKKLFK